MLDLHRSNKALFLWGWCLVAGFNAYGAPRPSSNADAPVGLHVLWNDAYGLLPSVALAAMTIELESLFHAEGVVVKLHAVRRGRKPKVSGPRVRVVLHPVEPKKWNLHRDVMAAAVGEPEKGYTIFVFHPAVLRTLGQSGRPDTPASVSRLARAMGRIVAHEVVHALVPERGHAPHGLMASQLTRRTLLQRSVWLDGTSARRVALALEPDTGAPRPVVAPPMSTSFVWSLR